MPNRGHVNVSIAFEHDLHHRLLAVCDHEDRTVSSLVRRVMRMYIEQAEARIAAPGANPETLAPPYDRWPIDEFDMPDTEDEKQQDTETGVGE